jgi:4-hydroxy-3-polyprenylbenzoate decarboxylase
MARYLIAMTGASVLHDETGLKPSDLEPHVKKIFADSDLAAPFSSGSNRYDALVVIPCSVSTMAKIAAGIADTLITRAAQVAMKERMRIVLCVRETPLSTLALRNALELSREGVVIMPIAPPWYRKPGSLEDLVSGFSDKVLGLLGEDAGKGWREDDLE